MITKKQRKAIDDMVADAESSTRKGLPKGHAVAKIRGLDHGELLVTVGFVTVRLNRQGVNINSWEENQEAEGEV